MNTPEDITPPPPTDAVGPPLAPGAANGEDPVADPPRPAGSAKSAMVWTLIGYGGSQLIRFVSQIILAGLVFPDVFGLIRLVYAFVVGLHMFTDVGIVTSLIQSPRGDDPDFYNTAWTLQIVRGACLWIGTILIAWPVSLMFDEPLLMWLLPAVGLNSFIEGFTSTALPTLNRHLRRERYILLDLSTSFIGSAVTIAYAEWVAPSAWAMVVGPTVNFVLMMAISHIILPGYRNHFRWDRTALHDLLHFGKWIFLGTICTFLAFQADSIIVGGCLRLDRTPEQVLTQVGVYGIAASFVGITTSLLGAMATQMVFPLYSRWHQAGRDIRSEFPRIHCAAAGLAALLVSGMVVTGPAVVRVMYRSEYYDAGWIMQILAVGAWFSMLEGTVGALCLALGQPRAVTISNATKLAGLLIFVPLGFWLGRLYGESEGSFRGLLYGFVLSDVVRYVMVQFVAQSNGVRGWPFDLILSVFIVMIIPVGSWVGETGALSLLGSAPATRWDNFVVFVCQGVPVTAMWAAVGFVWWQRSKRIVPEPSKS